MAISNEEKQKRIHQRKMEALRKYEKDYWKKVRELKTTFSTSASSLEDDLDKIFPENRSSFVFVATDGVVLERCLVHGMKNAFVVHYLAKPLEKILNPVPVVTFDGKIISSAIATAIGCNITLINFGINGEVVQNAEITSFLFSDEKVEAPPIEEALEDLRLFLLGANLGVIQNADNVQIKTTVIETLEKIVSQFGQLLLDAQKEEEVQIFLKENSILIDQYAERIPKQKLGEDFITDFVLLNNLDQGPTYTLVEIERASASIFVSGDNFSSDFRHAEKQILEWDLWLEQNKGYLQNKLKGFESPKFKIIMGRSNTLSEKQKGLIRVWNRHQTSTKLVTYDDLIAKTNELITNLKKSRELENAHSGRREGFHRFSGASLANENLEKAS